MLKLVLLVWMFLCAQVRGANPTASVTISKSNVWRTSLFSSGVSLVDGELASSSAGATNAKNLIRNGVGYLNSHIMAWGVEDPWPDPTAVEPNMNSNVIRQIDARMNITLGTSVKPILTLCEAPWWMKGLTSDQEWSDEAYSRRVLDNKIPQWLLLVQRIAERYMSPPWNVRHFQVWNEFKGYYNVAENDWDSGDSPGDPSGNNAKHGYTYMYNQVYARLRSVATAKGINPDSVLIGGPYVVADTWKDTHISDPSNLIKPYGVFDNRVLVALSNWLALKTGGGFICYDGGNGNRDGSVIADDFTRSEKFRDLNNWIISQPGGANIPIIVSEFYVSATKSADGNFDPTRSNAVKTYAIIEAVKANLKTALFWGGSFSGNDALWTPVDGSSGGKATLFYNTSLILNSNFGAGTALYSTTINNSTRVAAIASRNNVLLVNKLTSSLTVTIDGTYTTTLAPLEVKNIPINWWTCSNGWSDSFSSFNVSRWTAVSGATWSQTYFKSTQAKSGSTGLTLNMTKSGCPSACGGSSQQSARVKTNQPYQYGTIQVVLQASANATTWIFWEVSISKRDGYEFRITGSSLSLQYYSQGTYYYIGSAPLPFNPSTGLYRYTFKRTASKVSLYANGVLMLSSSAATLAQQPGDIELILQADSAIAVQTTTTRVSSFKYYPDGCDNFTP